MKIYLAGRITGEPGYKIYFGRIANLLRNKGHIVINPAELQEGMEHHEYMHICYAMIDVVDVIYLLHGWEESKGANLEVEYAKKTGKPYEELREKHLRDNDA
jgi:hypothetical protein